MGTWAKEDLVLLSLLGVLQLEPLRLDHHRHEKYRRRGEHNPRCRLGKAGAGQKYWLNEISSDYLKDAFESDHDPETNFTLPVLTN